MDVTNVLSTKVLSVRQIFTASHGFVVPEYQRTYQWNQANIQQLFDDVIQTIQLFARSSQTDHEIRFLGSIITISHERQYSKYGNLQPAVSHEIVDGQQRLTTFAIVSMVLNNQLKQSLGYIRENNSVYIGEHDEMVTILQRYVSATESLFVARMEDSHQRIPFIIRAEEDSWEADKNKYASPVARRMLQYANPSDKIEIGTNTNEMLITKNIAFINEYLIKMMRGDLVSSEEDEYEDALKFNTFEVTHRLTDLLGVASPGNIRRKLMKIASNGEGANDNDIRFEQIVRLILFTHFFLNRCHLNHIATKSEHWAFDMFIGLNTVGIPLSAVETFRAYLQERQRQTDLSPNGLKREISELFTSDEYGIQKYLEKSQKQNEREKKPKEFVTAFALYFSGEKVGYSINEQRDYLKRSFDSFIQRASLASVNSDDVIIKYQSRYIAKMAGLTKFLVDRDGLLEKTRIALDGMSNVSVGDRELTALCLAFLDDSKHSIVEPLLARFYDELGSQRADAGQAFCDAVKSVTAFFVLWRAVNGTLGLPDIYRKFMAEHASYITAFGQQSKFYPDVALLKSTLLLKLSEGHPTSVTRNLDRVDSWLSSAATQISYNKMKDICRFILLMTSHDTIPDSSHPGLVVEAATGYQRYATFEHWGAQELKSIEHIAPQNRNNAHGAPEWDANLYDSRGLYQSIGNLVLMPLELNISASNSGWSMKWIYYQYLALGSTEARDEFENTVITNYGFTPDKKILRSLKAAKYAGHMQHIVAVSRDGNWSEELVTARTQRMLQIFHKRMIEWLS